VAEELVSFNNIQIQGTVVSIVNGAKLDDYIYDLENCFFPPVLSLDGTILYLWARTDDEGQPLFKNLLTGPLDAAGTPFTFLVEIVINAQVKDTSGIPLGKKTVVNYRMMDYDRDGPGMAMPNSENDTISSRPSAFNHLWAVKAVPGKTEFSREDFDDYDNEFDSISDDNWVYIIFNADVTNDPVCGAFVFERPAIDWWGWINDDSNEDGSVDFEWDYYDWWYVWAEYPHTLDEARKDYVTNWWGYPEEGSKPGSGTYTEILDFQSAEYKGIIKAIREAMEDEEDSLSYLNSFPVYVAKYKLDSYSGDDKWEPDSLAPRRQWVELMLLPVTRQDLHAGILNTGPYELPGTRKSYSTSVKTSQPEFQAVLHFDDSLFRDDEWKRMCRRNVYLYYDDND
jgi:hypothetical protein